MGSSEEQSDEVLALRSIYDGQVFTAVERSGCTEGSVSVDVEISRPFEVAETQNEDVRRCVEHLPPIVLKFSLPHDYPSVNPPGFTLTCPWLTETQLSRLSEELHQMWTNNSGSVILFSWIGFLQNESLAFLDIRSPLVLSSIETLQVVLEYDRNKRIDVFDRQLFSCQVCLCDKPGTACMEFLECGHVFCRACLRNFFELYITEGAVDLLKCPEDKCETRAHPNQVKELVSEALFERYDRLMFQLSLDTMNDIVYCPRKGCGSPVVVDGDAAMGTCAECQHVFCLSCQKAYHGLAKCRSDLDDLFAEDDIAADGAQGVDDPATSSNADDEEDYVYEGDAAYEDDEENSQWAYVRDTVRCPRLKCGSVATVEKKTPNRGCCRKCLYQFCVHCKRAYHGVAFCQFKSGRANKISTIYKYGSDLDKLELERKYGKKLLQKFIEEHSSKEWLKQNSKTCPNCSTHVQKLDGCNKMTCSKCHCYFCWLCLEELPKDCPYQHFTDKNTPCFNAVHRVEALDEGGGPDWDE